MALLTRLQMVDKIEDGEPVIFNGRIYYTVESLPTQDEIDAVYAGATISTDLSPVVAAVGDVLDVLPAALDADGGFKVHVQNGSEGGGTGLTDTELRATPVPTAVSNFPATQPVSLAAAVPVTDNGGSLTVDGPLTDTQLRATPVPVTQTSLPLPTGASTSAKQDTGNTSLASIDTKATLGANSGLKVDIVGNTVGLGGAAYAAPTSLFASAARTVDTSSSDIVNSSGAKGIRLFFFVTTLNSSTISIRVEEKDASARYATLVQSGTFNSNGSLWTITIYPGLTEQTTGNGNQKFSQYAPRTFRVSVIIPSQGVSNTWDLSYSLLP